MSQHITHDQKETAIEALRVHGTMQYASRIAGVSVRTLNEEMKRSEVFKRRVIEARTEGKVNIADKAIELIKSYAYGENEEKTDRNRLTAAIALANAYEPGFRGTSQVQGRIEHDVRVITGVPRPNYQITVEEPKRLPMKTIKTVIKDKDGNYVGTKSETVEDVIEGVVIDGEAGNKSGEST